MTAPGHPLDLAAMAAYGAYTISVADRAGEMLPWDDLSPEVKADWRAVADGVQMATSLSATYGQGAAAERERLFVAIRHALPLSAPWRGEALDLIAEVWRKDDPR